MNLDGQLRIGLLILLFTSVSCNPGPWLQKWFGTNVPAPNVSITTTTDNLTIIEVYGQGEKYDTARLANLTAPYSNTRRIALHGLVLQDPLPDEWAELPFLRTLYIDCEAEDTVPGTGDPVGQFGSDAQLEALRDLILRKKSGSAINIRNITILNCGIAGDYGRVWRDYFSEVQIVNLTGNALTGGFTSIDNFDKACNDTFAGEDYEDPDCSDMQWLDVSSNRLSGPISTNAALGDDVTDAICSTACISLVMSAGITDDEVLCQAPLVIFALNNPNLTYRGDMRYASGYVTKQYDNWCRIPESRWVLPTMWGVFLTVFLFTLAMTLYARVRLKRVPFRITNPSFDILPRGASVNVDSVAVRPPSAVRRGAGSDGGYMGLAGSAVAVELVERQAMIPKDAAGVTISSSGSGSSSDGGANGSAAPLAFVSARALFPTALPVSTVPAVPPEAGGGANGANGVGRSRSASTKRDPNGMRVALTAGMDSSDSAGVKPGVAAASTLDVQLFDENDLEPASGGGGRKMTLGGRIAGSRTSTAGGAAVGAVGDGERTWRAWLRAALWRGLEILGMQLRTLLILGMFGLECYWAYGLIRYRGGWQLLVLIPNYLEQTLAGIAMLRAFMAGTHGRWKYVAPIPLLPFTMSAVYLVYGFITYPFGFADFGPISWEKFIDLMDSCGVLSSTCWAIFSSLAYWRGNSVNTSYQYFNTTIFVGMMFMCFTDLLSTAHHLASTLQVPFKQWLRRELDVRKVKIAPDKSHRLQGDGDL